MLRLENRTGIDILQKGIMKEKPGLNRNVDLAVDVDSFLFFGRDRERQRTPNSMRRVGYVAQDQGMFIPHSALSCVSTGTRITRKTETSYLIMICSEPSVCIAQ